MSTISPNMGLTISTIGADSGLQWEENLNASMNTLDGHNHSPGSGVPIQPNGLNISADLPFQGNNATLVRALRFSPQVAAIPNSGADIGELYVAGNELYYNDVSGGHQVQLTSAGTVNATSSGISSGSATAAFSGTTLVVKSSSTSYANVDVQSIVLANSGNLTNQLTLQAPSLSGSIAETLPTPPASVTSIMQMDTSGNMSAAMTVDGSTIVNTANVLGVGAASIGPTQLVATPITSSSQIGSGVVTGTNIAATTVANSNLVALTSLTGSTSSGTVVAGGATVSSVISGYTPTVNRPLFITFGGYFALTGASATTFNLAITSGLVTIANLSFTPNSTTVYPFSMFNTILNGNNVGATHILTATVSSGSGSNMTVTNLTVAAAY